MKFTLVSPTKGTHTLQIMRPEGVPYPNLTFLYNGEIHVDLTGLSFPIDAYIQVDGLPFATMREIQLATKCAKNDTYSI